MIRREHQSSDFDGNNWFVLVGELNVSMDNLGNVCEEALHLFINVNVLGIGALCSSSIIAKCAIIINTVRSIKDCNYRVKCIYLVVKKCVRILTCALWFSRTNLYIFYSLNSDRKLVKLGGNDSRSHRGLYVTVISAIIGNHRVQFPLCPLPYEMWTMTLLLNYY